MYATSQDFYLEGMVYLAMSKIPGILDHTPRKMKRRILVNRVIYAQLIEVVCAGRAENKGCGK